MIIDLINYSLDQNHQNFSLKEIEQNLLFLNNDNKKYIIYYSNIAYFGGSRNKDEVGIQLSVSTKHKLIGYTAEEYEIVILGYDAPTNTFTFWKYDKYFETNTKQSLYSRRSSILEAKKEGFAKFFHKRRDTFNNKKNDQRSISFSCNAFLFPLILKYYSKIFDRDFGKDFNQKIKRHNFPYCKDDLLLSLNLYFHDRNTKNIDKKDPRLEEASRLCSLRFKLLGFNPIDKFIPDKYTKKFRNTNGIYTKVQNFKFTDPNEQGGYPGGAHVAQKKIWDNYCKNGIIDKDKIQKDAKNLSERIISEKIEILIGYKKISKIKLNNDNQEGILAENDLSPEILEIELNKSYKQRNINPNNFSDKIDALNLLDKSNKLHEKIVNNLAKIFKQKKLPIQYTKHIDFLSIKNNKGYLFEVKTFNESNFNQQIRHGIIQLREYYFTYGIYFKKIPLNTSLYLLLDKNPKEYLKNVQQSFLRDQRIALCWIENNKIMNLNEEILF